MLESLKNNILCSETGFFFLFNVITNDGVFIISHCCRIQINKLLEDDVETVPAGNFDHVSFVENIRKGSQRGIALLTK